MEGRSPDRPRSAGRPTLHEDKEVLAYRSFGLSGGVANNRTLQAELEKVARRANVPFFRAEPRHTGDNAGMIAFAAWAEREAGAVKADGFALEIAPSLPLAE